MEDEIQSLDDLASRSDGNVIYKPICDQSISVPARPHFAFGHQDNDLMNRYYLEAFCESTGLYIAAGLGIFERQLLIRGNAALRCDKIRADGVYLSNVMPKYRSVSGSVTIRRISGTVVLLLGRGYKVYGHWLVDFLPKLFILEKLGYDLTQLGYLIPADAPEFGIKLLDLIGITPANLIAYDQRFELVRPDVLLIPTLVRTGNRPGPMFKDAVTFVASRIWSRYPGVAIRDDMKRVFVSRGLLNTETRRLLNRDKIERLAIDSGFSVIHPEQMSLREQFAVFANAHQIAGDYGSALHTSIFSDPATMVCVLRPNRCVDGAGFIQLAIGGALGQPTGYVFGDVANGDPTRSFTISEDAFQSYLELLSDSGPLNPSNV